LPGVTILLELQDSRFLGSGDPAQARGTTDATADGLDMHQANVRIERVLDLPIDVRLGRQEISFNNERLVGSAPWINTARSFDGARATMTMDDVNFDLFGARLSAPAASPAASQNLYGLWCTYRPSAAVHAEVYGLRDDNTSRVRVGDDSGKSVLERYHIGTYLKGTYGMVDVEVEGIGQAGGSARDDSSVRRDIRAFLLSASVWVTVADDSKTKLQALASVLSGDGSAGDTISETFNTLFGTNHKFYGTMDYVPALSGDLGVVDLSGAVQTTPASGLRMLLEGHLLLPQRNGGDGNFGTEIDLTVWWRRVAAFELSGGASVFMPGELLESRLGEKPRYWIYLAGMWQI